uniref:Neighbor of COX4 n=1 Tax=Lygus hesperus TaxID=30085 RepID=A0A0A9YWR6_LYGHE
MGFLIGKSIRGKLNNDDKAHTTATTAAGFVASVLPAGDADGQNAVQSCYITDAIPLFHTLPMTYPHPMVDVALAHVNSIAKTNGLSLLGLYIANERCNDHTLSPLLLPLLAMLQSYLSSQDVKLLV